MTALPIRLRSLRPLLMSIQTSCRALCTPPPAAPTNTHYIPNKIDEAYLSTTNIDIESLFLSQRVQKLLRDLTCIDLKKVFAPRKGEISPPSYKLLTDEQLKQEVKKVMRKRDHFTQMPPVLRKRKPCERVLREDPELQGYLSHKIIFTDISAGHDEMVRPIVVREPDGTLRTASWEERERMLQIFFTNPARELELPRMFKEPQLTSVLDSGKYLFVLDRACVQFEPNSEDYIGVTQRVYAHLKETKKFDVLRSTRHFGPMCFYFAVTKQCDELMLEMLTSRRLRSAANLVKLLHEIHPDLNSVKEVNDDSTPEQYVEAYIKWESQKKSPLELALQMCRELKEAGEMEPPEEDLLSEAQTISMITQKLER